MGIGTAMYNALTGLDCFSTAISVVSDNVANSGTTAFKSNKARFGDLVNTYYALQSNQAQGEGSGACVMGIQTDFAQGVPIETSSWSDLAIGGEGFFIVEDPTSGTTYYTRDGSFHLDENNNLVNQLGYVVQGYAGGAGALTEVTLADPPGGAYYVSMYVETDGTLHTLDSTGATDTPFLIGLSAFSNKNGLTRQGKNLYTAGPDHGTQYYNIDTPGMFGQVMDNTLESSNVDIAKEMVDMILYQAGYNANSKVITTASDMVATTINMIR